MISIFLAVIAIVSVSLLFFISMSGIKFYTLNAEVDEPEKKKDSIKLKIMCIIMLIASIFSIVTLLFI
jgi:hypothetical protein